MAKLYYYYSAMNAGKSTTLLQSSYNYRERGMKTLLFTAKLDTRFKPGSVYSRIGIQDKAIPFSPNFNFYQYINQQLQADPNSCHCLLIDEAQFLTKDQVYQLTDIADNLNLPVIAYGLRSDFQGEPFPGSLYLLAWAEEINEIKTICHCGKKAIMNMRLDEQGKRVLQGEQIKIGGNESYVSTCRRHFKAGVTQSTKDNSRKVVEKSFEEG